MYRRYSLLYRFCSRSISIFNNSKDFQSIISKEIKEQILEKGKKLPYAVITCVGVGPNVIGSFYNFIKNVMELYLVLYF